MKILVVRPLKKNLFLCVFPKDSKSVRKEGNIRKKVKYLSKLIHFCNLGAAKMFWLGGEFAL